MSFNRTLKHTSSKGFSPFTTSLVKRVAIPSNVRTVASFKKVFKNKKDPIKNPLKGDDQFIASIYDSIPGSETFNLDNVHSDKLNGTWLTTNNKGEKVVIVDHLKKKYLSKNFGSSPLQEILGASYLTGGGIDHITLIFTDYSDLTSFSKYNLCDHQHRVAIICCTGSEGSIGRDVSLKGYFNGLSISKVFVGKSDYKDFLPSELLKHQIIDLNELGFSGQFGNLIHDMLIEQFPKLQIKDSTKAKKHKPIYQQLNHTYQEIR